MKESHKSKVSVASTIGELISGQALSATVRKCGWGFRDSLSTGEAVGAGVPADLAGQALPAIQGRPVGRAFQPDAGKDWKVCPTTLPCKVCPTGRSLPVYGRRGRKFDTY